jgi:hypothetical protein
MGKNKKKNGLSISRSKCCFAPVVIGGVGDFRKGDNIVTMYYMCTKCEMACDIIIATRKEWTRNPKTQIMPDKREKNIKKQLDKEIKEDK